MIVLHGFLRGPEGTIHRLHLLSFRITTLNSVLIHDRLYQLGEICCGLRRTTRVHRKFFKCHASSRRGGGLFDVISELVPTARFCKYARWVATLSTEFAQHYFSKDVSHVSKDDIEKASRRRGFVSPITDAGEQCSTFGVGFVIRS